MSLNFSILISNTVLFPQVSPRVANESKVLTDFLQTYQPEMDAIPLTKVDAKIFEKIIEYCEHQGTPRPLLNGEIGEWDSEFLKLDQNTLFDLVLVSRYFGTVKVYVTCFPGCKLFEYRKSF